MLLHTRRRAGITSTRSTLTRVRSDDSHLDEILSDDDVRSERWWIPWMLSDDHSCHQLPVTSPPDDTRHQLRRVGLRQRRWTVRNNFNKTRRKGPAGHLQCPTRSVIGEIRIIFGHTTKRQTAITKLPAGRLLRTPGRVQCCRTHEKQATCFSWLWWPACFVTGSTTKSPRP